LLRESGANAWVWRVLRLYDDYRDGRLPFAGGVLNQPVKLMAMFRVCAAEIARADGEKKRRRSRSGGGTV